MNIAPGLLVGVFQQRQALEQFLHVRFAAQRLVFMARRQNGVVRGVELPNEVGPLFCPYDALSSFALEPAYICLKDFPEISGEKFKSSCVDVNYVDYALKAEKLQLLWRVYLTTDLSEAMDFEEFQRKNAYWLLDFALFKGIIIN